LEISVHDIVAYSSETAFSANEILLMIIMMHTLKT